MNRLIILLIYENVPRSWSPTVLIQRAQNRNGHIYIYMARDQGKDHALMSALGCMYVLQVADLRRKSQPHMLAQKWK